MKFVAPIILSVLLCGCAARRAAVPVQPPIPPAPPGGFQRLYGSETRSVQAPKLLILEWTPPTAPALVELLRSVDLQNWTVIGVTTSNSFTVTANLPQEYFKLRMP